MVKQKIVISERDNLAALFEDDQVSEFIIHRGDVLLGDVYLAQVENILPSIDAAFVNVGTERMGFLHSSDVQGRGDLKNRLQPKQRLLVQVIKEPTGHKGPRVTTNLALPGRFLVLLPDSKGVSISRKILNPKERIRLKSILSIAKPPGVGVIIRTEAEEQSDAEIQDDFETLMERWQNIVAMADTAQPPALLHRDQDLLYRVVREFVCEDTQEIVLDTQFGVHRAQQLLQNWGVQQPIKVSLYDGNQNILVATGVEKEIKGALQTRVPLPSGGYIYVQPTEALTVVDVNSGKFTSLESQEETILHTNLEAAKEIARQLRLRNVGGMVVVDFIDMATRANQLKVLQAFEGFLETDKAKPQVGQLSDLGLVEMTRHRQGQALAEIFSKKCGTCNSNGHVVEDFHWAPPAGADYSRYGNQKFPYKTQQQQARSGGNNQQRQQGGRQQNGAQKPGQGVGRFMPNGPEGLPLREGFLQQASNAQALEEKDLVKQLKLQELFTYFMTKRYGLLLAAGVKLGILPIEVNAVVSRYNPKANDVFALVKAIETSGGVMPTSEDDNDEDDDDSSEEFESDESAAVAIADNDDGAELPADEVEEVVAAIAEENMAAAADADEEVVLSSHPYLAEELLAEPLDPEVSVDYEVADDFQSEVLERLDGDEGDDDFGANGKKSRRGRPPKRARIDSNSEIEDLPLPQPVE